MPTRPAPLTKTQRRHANEAKRLQDRITKTQGALDQLRMLRDEKITVLVADGVRPFGVAQETGCPPRLPEQIARDVRKAKALVAKAAGRRKAGAK